jgi:drug/metabolite transporter (DMT)-like permease
MERLGADRTGLFNGLIPVTSLVAVVLVGTGTMTPLRLLGALAVLAGVIIGLGRAPQAQVTASEIPAPARDPITLGG